jgi:hypothetical protein
MADGPADPAGNQIAQRNTYELLAQKLAQRLSDHFGADTEICKHNTKINGRGTNNQIDVIWVGTINGSRRRIIIECKHYADPIEQGLVHRFVSVLDDIKDPQLPTIGVFITPVGYQRGAKDLAAANDVFILEVREPSDADVEGLILKVTVGVVIQTLVFSAVEFEWVTPPVEETWPQLLAETAVLHADPANPDPVTAIPLQQVLASKLGHTLEEQMAAAQATSTRIHADFDAVMTDRDRHHARRHRNRRIRPLPRATPRDQLQRRAQVATVSKTSSKTRSTGPPSGSPTTAKSARSPRTDPPPRVALNPGPEPATVSTRRKKCAQTEPRR